MSFPAVFAPRPFAKKRRNKHELSSDNPGRKPCAHPRWRLVPVKAFSFAQGARTGRDMDSYCTTCGAKA